MAYLPNQDQQTQSQGGIPTLQGSGGPSVSAGSGRSGPASSPGAAPSTPWSNISSYLTANAGQAGKVADTLAGNLTNQYNTANQQIGQAAQGYGQQIESNRVPLDQSLAQRAASTPSQLVQNPNDVAAFQKMYNAQYKGPQDFSSSDDYSELVSGVEKAQKNAALVNQGTPGIQTLLQQAESAQGRNPTQGITALDTLLLQEAPENFGKIAEAAKPFSGLSDYLGSTQKGLDTAAQNAAKEAAQTQSTLQNQFIGPGGVAPTLQNQFNQSLQTASGQAKTYNDTIASIINSLNANQNLTQQQYHDVDPSGILQTLTNPGGGSGIFDQMVATGMPGISPNMLTQFYNAPDQVAQPGLENVLTPEQFANAQALNQLIGQDVVGVPQQLGKQFSAPTGYGDFRGHDALQSLLDTLVADESYLPQMSPEQQSAYMLQRQALGSYLGLPSTYQGPPIQPSGTPVSPFPNGQTPQGNPVVSGGGRAFR